MAYIGRQPKVGNFQICDAISVVNGQAAYTMQVGSVNVLPETANHMIVSLNGVIQKPNSSFTVSGSTITFSSNLATGDVIDFIQILGDVLDLGVPSDATVTTAKLADSSVSLAKLTATGTKDATTFLRGDNTFAEAGGGKILQVVSDTLTSEYTTGSASFSDTGLTLNITPSATSSKILLMMSGTAYVNTSGNSIIFTFLRGSTNLATGDSSGAYGFARLQSNAGNLVAVQSPMHVDSPSSSSQLTYKVQGRLESASGAGQLSINSTTSTLIAMEIGA